MFNFVRLTRHEATDEQLFAIEKVFGEINILEEKSITFPQNPFEAVAVFDQEAEVFDVAEIVAPINILQAIMNNSQFVKNGGIVVRSVMDRTLNEDGSAVFTFSHYEKIEEVKIVTTPL
jgi:hypothetical protein